jgi:hypothetical protein
VPDTPRYTPPNTSAEHRAGVQECLDRAQRSLEVAELNLDTVSALFAANRSTILFADLLTHADARTRLGGAWADLAESKLAWAEAVAE